MAAMGKSHTDIINIALDELLAGMESN